jgi:hypothetical protein
VNNIYIQKGEDIQDWTARTGQPEWISQKRTNRTSETGQAKQDR